MLDTSFSPWPSFSDEEVLAVSEVLRSGRVNYWTGSECIEFENEFAAWCGTQYAVALGNGTQALDLIIEAMNIGPGDEVVITPRTFIASISCVVRSGATPVFADIDINSGNITADSISKVITPRTKAVVCVHLGGWPCDLDPIMALARSHNFKVIEDCAQAHGARYKGRCVGSIGDAGAWSFCQDKIITTGGEGGMVTTSDELLWRNIWSLKDHGKSYSKVFETTHPPGYRWLHDQFGTNARMIEMQATIGRVQLKLLPNWTKKRTENARKIIESVMEFSGVGGVIGVPIFGCSESCRSSTGSNTCGFECVHGYYRLYLRVRPENLRKGWSRDRILEEIVRLGVPCYQGSCSEVYLEKAFDTIEWLPNSELPNAHLLTGTSLAFLVHPTLTKEEIEKSANVISTVLRQAKK